MDADVGQTAMSEEYDADKPTEEEKGTSSVNRRRFVKSLGAAGTVGVLGLGTTPASAQKEAISTDEVEGILQRKESQVVLDTATVDAESLKSSEATEQKINSAPWIEVPVAGNVASYFAYNTANNIAEIKTGSNSIVRAKPEDDGIFVENLKMGEEVTTAALQTLETSADWNESLENGDIATVNTADAAAHLDKTSGVTRAFISAKLQNGDKILLIAEINENDRLKSVYGFPGKSDGITTQQSAIDCWANCITWGTFCSTPCSVCVSAPTPYICAPCGACLGGTAVVCAGKCGIEQFW